MASNTNQDAFNNIHKEIELRIQQTKDYFKDKSPIEYWAKELSSLWASESMTDFMDHRLSLPVTCVSCIGIYCFAVTFLCWVFASGELIEPTISHRNATISPPPKHDKLFYRTVDQTMGKLLELRSSGDVKAFDHLLDTAMHDFCIKQLGRYYLDTIALDSFHLNLAESILFVAEGNEFTAHESMTVTPFGGIVDPFDVDSNEKGSKSCPLVDALFQRGSAEKKEGHPHAIEAEEEDRGCKFDQRFDFKFINNFLDVATHHLTKPDLYPDSKCTFILETFSKETVRSLLLNWAELVDVIGSETEEEYPRGEGQDEWESFVPDPESSEFKKYIVGRDGGIYRTDNYDEIDDGFLWCEALEYFLNTKFILVDGYSYTAIKIGIEERFDQWYTESLVQMESAGP